MSLYLKRRKKILKKTCVGFSLFFLGAAGYLLTSVCLKAAGLDHLSKHPATPLFVISLITLLAFKPLDIAFTKFFKHFLFKKKAYGHMVLMNLAEDLQTHLNLQEFANLTVNTFGEVLQLKTVSLLIPVKNGYELIAGYGWKLSDLKKVKLTDHSPLMHLVQENGPHVLVRDRLIRSLPWQEANRLAHDFTTLQASWVIPLFVKDHFVGALAFASWSPESIFDEADFQFFRAFAATISRSLWNALRFYEILKTNEVLKDAQGKALQQTKMAAIEQLASGIAHEIHNPLTIISGKAQVLLLRKDKSGMDEKVEDVLKTIVQQTKRAADITRKLLMFSQTSGVPKESLSLEQVLLDTLALVSYQTSLEGIQITHSAGTNVPPFVANMQEMREVFLNLILNAVESLKNGGKIHCEINYRDKEQLIEIMMLDSGPGIPEQNLEQLFNPFFATQHGKIGLGLFVTRQIIHRYGGSIRAESRVGEGSLFIIHLPAKGKSFQPELPSVPLAVHP